MERVVFLTARIQSCNQKKSNTAKQTEHHTNITDENSEMFIRYFEPFRDWMNSCRASRIIPHLGARNSSNGGATSRDNACITAEKPVGEISLFGLTRLDTSREG